MARRVLMPVAMVMMAAATALLTLSPITGEWEVLQSNYIPVLFNGLFFLSLGLLAAGLLVLLLPMLYSRLRGQLNSGRSDVVY